MKKLLIIEDQPEYKIDSAIKWLKKENIEFEYEIVGSINSAKRYLSNKNNKLDLIILDLGLPIFDNGRVENLLSGLEIMYSLETFEINVPVIINSTTNIPNQLQLLSEFENKGYTIMKVYSISNVINWLIEFLTN